MAQVTHIDETSHETQHQKVHPERRLVLRENYDMCLLIMAAALLPFIVQLPIALLRVPLGLLIVLAAPGYALTAALFVRNKDLEGMARVGLTFGLSIASYPLLALLLDQCKWGITLWSMTLSLSLWIVFFSGIAILRRWIAPLSHSGEFVGIGSIFLPRLRGRTTVAVAGLVVCVLLVGYACFVVVQATTPSPTTEFYALGAQGLAQDYPRQAAPGQVMEVTLGINNHEGSSQRYRIEVRTANMRIAERSSFTLNSDATWQEPLRYALDAPGDNQSVEILLFRNDETTAYRTLKLWVNIRGRL